MHEMTPENRTKYLCTALLYAEFPKMEDHNACMSFMAGSFWDTNTN